jgi:hypothetical protein
LVVLVLGWSWFALFADPQGAAAGDRFVHAELVDAWGLVSLFLATLILAGVGWAAGWRPHMGTLAGGLVALAVVASAVAARWDTGDWIAYHTLVAAHALIAAVLVAVAWHDRRAAAWFAGSHTSAWVDAARTVLLVLAVRELPHGRWWPVAAFAVLAVTGAASGWLFQRRRYLYDAALMINVGGTIAWNEAVGSVSFVDVVLLNVILLTLPVAGWLAIERSSISRRESGPTILVPPVHRVALRLAIFVLGCTAAIGLFRDATQLAASGASEWMRWAALAATTLSAVVCLWDTRTADAIARLYILGLVAVAMPARASWPASPGSCPATCCWSRPWSS